MSRICRSVAAVAAALLAAPSLAAESLVPPQHAPHHAPHRGESHRSAFDGFKAFDDARETDWAVANARVREIGGHAGVLKESPDDPPDGNAPAAHHGRHP